MKDGADFAQLVSAAQTDTAALKELMALSLSAGFMARLARKELSQLGIQVSVNDSPAAAANVR